MTLTSVSFAVFVFVALIVYYAVPLKYRWIALLAASMAFYGIVCFKYMPYILVTTVSTFFGAKVIESIQTKSKAYIKEHKKEWTKEQKSEYKAKVTTKKKLVLAATLVFNFGILAVVKYCDFFVDTFVAVLKIFHVTIESPHLGFVLPLGISFYTFQAMGYIIDVYRQKVKAQTNLFKFALFVSFFPQIVQGPIGIYDKLADQLYEGHKIDYDNLKFGFQLVLWGLAKKLIIADRAVCLINYVCNDAYSFSGAWILTAALFYSIQLYTDFSGGIDISRGVARMFGIEMAINFNRPYFSKTISEYWRRWHITLGAWLKDYLFYPIAMSSAFLKLGRKSKEHLGKHVGKILPASIATFITFIVIGVWHGANWKYVAFGAWNGLIIFLSNMLEPTFASINEKLKINTEKLYFRVFRMFRTFLIVLVGYYFDIANNFSEAMMMMWRSVTDVNPADLIDRGIKDAIGLHIRDYLIIIFGSIFLLFVSLYQEKKNCIIRYKIAQCKAPVRWFIMIASVMAIILLGMYGPGTSASEFVYMQF